MTKEQLQSQRSMPQDPFGKISFTDEIYGKDVKAYSGNRDAALRELLGTDYEFAHESGLLNMFYYNPDSGEDGLMHVLGGEQIETAEGVRIVRGFHHEPSGETAWVYDSHGNMLEKSDTKVDRTHLMGANSRRRREFLQLPHEPYLARVVIGGLKKITPTIDRQTGESTLVDTNNSMFPKEYDALTVLRTVAQATKNRDKSQDKLSKNSEVITTVGTAKMLDGETNMRIKLVLDAKTGKVISAYPIVKPKAMNLSRQEVKKQLGL